MRQSQIAIDGRLNHAIPFQLGGNTLFLNKHRIAHHVEGLLLLLKSRDD